MITQAIHSGKTHMHKKITKQATHNNSDKNNTQIAPLTGKDNVREAITSNQRRPVREHKRQACAAAGAIFGEPWGLVLQAEQVLTGGGRGSRSPQHPGKRPLGPSRPAAAAGAGPRGWAAVSAPFT